MFFFTVFICFAMHAAFTRTRPTDSTRDPTGTLENKDKRACYAFSYHRHEAKYTRCTDLNSRKDDKKNLGNAAHASSAAYNRDGMLALAVAGITCPTVEVALAMNKWREWWALEAIKSEPNVGTSAQDFFEYATRRQMGKIPDLPSLIEFEESLVQGFGNTIQTLLSTQVDHSLVKRSQQAAEARNFQNDADLLRAEYSVSICAHAEFGKRPQDIIFGFAIQAVKCPCQPPEMTELVQKWRWWWESVKEPNPCDTRTDADRLLRYALERRTDAIPNTDSITLFERELAMDISIVIKRQVDLNSPCNLA